MKAENAIRIHLAECALHAEVLAEGLADVGKWMPMKAGAPMEKEQVRILDQIAYRFAKLQDSMGDKILPLILELAQEPMASGSTFAEKLNRLEKIGAIPSADEWKKLRVARNAIAHEYPDEPELRVNAIRRFLKGAEELISIFRYVILYIAEHFGADSQ